MSFVSGQAKSLLGSVREGGRWGRDTFQDHHLHVVPHPSPWESSIKSMRMAWEDARNEMSVFESFERPFVFENLPSPALGRLKMRLEAMDEFGRVLPNAEMNIELDVVPENEVADPAASGRAAAASEPVDTTLTSLAADEPLPAPADDGPFMAQAILADTFTPIRIQAEDSDASDGASASIAGGSIAVVNDPNEANTANADGQAYVDYGNATGETLTFTFSVDEAGEYELALGYALSQNGDGTDRNRPLRLDVNGELQDRMFDLPSTTLTSNAADFSDFGERTIRVQLQAGENTVSFTSNGASGPNVDYLEVRAPDPDVYVIQGEDLVVEPNSNAESDATNRVVTVDNIASFTNGLETFRVGAEGASYLDWAFGNANAYGDFTLDVATAGTYNVTVTYATSDARSLNLSLVDDGTPTQIGSFAFLPTTAPAYYPTGTSDVPSGNLPGGGPAPSAWEGWSTETIEISLAAGSNTLRLGGGTTGPNIDKIEVALLAADPVDPTGPVIDAIVIQAEDAELGADNDAGTLVRDAQNPESGASFNGLRPDYSGTGYVDYGSQPGDSLTFTVNVAEAGSYDVNFRYASSGDRPMALAVNGAALPQQAFVSTDTNGSNEAPEGFDVWGYQSLTTELVAGDNTIVLSIPAGAGSGPNLDRLEVTTAGTGPVGDVEADTDETALAFSADNLVVNGANASAAGFNVTGRDDDIVFVGVTFDNGVTVDEVTPDADGNFTLDLSGRDDGDLSAKLIAMDAFGNRVERSLALTLDTTADEGGNLALEGPDAEIAPADSATVVFGVAGIDVDSTLEVSFDGGATRQSATSDGDSLSVDLSGQGPGDVTVTLIVTDTAGNEASVQDTVTLAAPAGPVSLSVTFDDATISAYNETQDNPASGTGAAVEDDGGTLSLTDNVWKRADLPSDYTITGQTLLTLDVAISASPVPEIVAIGFDADDNPFNGGNSVYQLGGTQTQGGFIDLRGQGVDNGDGTFRFTIDLAAHAGTTIDSLVFVNDDDLGAIGSASFSAVSLSEDEVPDTNSAPRVVGGGIADLSLDEGSNLEVDLPFVDDDGDALSYSFVVTDGDGQPVTVDGLSVVDQVLSGSLEGLAPGDYTVSVTADDGTVTTSTDFALTVENVNDAPVAEPVALEPYFGEVGENFIQIPLADFASLFSDPDGDSLTLSAEDLPAGLEVVDGVIQGTPSQGGTFDVVIRATDPAGLSSTQTLSFVIEGTQVGDSITIEAENFTDLDASNLIVTGSASASNEQLIRLTSNEPATIGTDLAAGGIEPGWYVARLYVFDENDGEGSLSLTIGDTVLEARNAASDSLSSDVVLSDDFGTIVGTGPRGNAGQSGNRKEIVFETPFEVTAGDLASLELRGAGGELMRIDSLVFERIDEPVNTAPTLEGLGADVSVDENSTIVANLAIDDADDDSLTVTLSGADAALFSFNEATGELAFINAPDAELAADSDENGIYELTVTVSDGEDSVSQDTLITVADLNESIVIGETTYAIDENLTEIGAIPVVDEDGLTTGLNAPVFAITGGVDAPLFTIDAATGALSFISARDFELAVDDDEDGVYAVEVTVTDGDLTDVQTLEVTVNDVDEAPFSPLSLQIQDGTVTSFDNDANDTDTTVRNPGNPEANENLENGLRPGFSGTGYLDFGDTAGDNVTWQVDVAQAGQYDISVRYATNSDRPLDLVINGGTPVVLDMLATDPDGTGPIEGFDNWLFETVTVTLEAGTNSIELAIPEGATTGPNIDRIEITEGGTGPIPVDDSADEDGNLTLTAADDTLEPGQLATALFNVAGADDDIVTYEISFDGGTTRTAVTPEANGDITVDLSDQSGSVTVTLIVTDAVGNEAQASDSVTVDDGTPVPFNFEIQGEALTIEDPDNVGDTLDTQVRDANNTETNAATGSDGLWDGFSGTGYLDMGGDVGDAGSFDVVVDEAGTYTLTVRYANGGGNGADRPMNILVGGESQGSLAFAATGADPDGWENWTDVEIEVELEAGTNTIRLENLTAAGPNIDRLSVTREGVEPPEVIEPGERFSVKINFQPEGVVVPDGYIADNGKAFGTQSVTIDGQTYQYGWVTEASIYDGEPGTTPLDISSLTSVAVNDRTDDIAGLDPRQGTYAHFDQPGSAYVRAGWEIELEDGYYEVTISIGDTSGPYDSRNVLNAEGELFNDPFTPFRPDDFPADGNPGDDTEGVRSDLVTRIVQVSDGRLTLDSLGLDNENTEIQYIEIQSLPDLTPDDAREAPEDYAFFTDARAIAGVGENEVEVDLDPEDSAIPTGVDPTSDIFVGISVVDGRGGALLESLNDGSVKLFETVTGEEVSFNVNTTGGFDSLTISPSQTLKPFTSYTLVIDGFRDRGPNDDADAPTREFQKYTNTFVTGEEPEVVARDVAFNDVVELNGAADNAFGFTSLEMSPDGAFMYIATIGGDLLRYDVDPVDGSLSNRQDLSLPNDYFDQPGQSQQRGIIGLVVDPTDPNVLWITDNYPIPLNGRDNGVPEFSGRITKITLDGGSDFSGTAEPYITGLPRSNGDHVTNSLEFRPNPDYDAATNPDVPTHLLYLIQGSNSAMGEPDSAWGNRPERLLNAAVMEIDPTRDAPPGGFDVSTEPVPDNGQNTRFDDPDGHPKDDPIPMGNGEFLVFDERGVATVQDADGNVLQSYYDPYAEGAVLTIFATGARNAYDLVWHSNGFLYVPTNGSAAGGNVPDDPSTPENERYTNVENQDDYLFKIVEGGYYGHPNPLRDEYILNGGNPTGGSDPNQVDAYPSGTSPEGNYDISGVYSLGENRSPNGAVEYTSNVFGGNLQGNVLFTEYSGGDDVRSITLDANGNVIGDDVLRDPEGNVITYVDPLDIIENPVTGQLYLLTLNRGNGQSQIIRLDPAPGGVVDPVDPDPEPGDDLVSLLVIQAEDDTPNDGTSVTIADGAGAEIQIRDINNTETTEGLPNGLRPGAFGLDGNTDGDDGVPGGYADYGSTNADFMTFGFNLAADDAGDSVLRIRYANGGDTNRPLEVFVNNVSVGVFDFSPPPGLTGDAAWAEWLTEDVAASLVVGENTVRLQATNNTGPNIDQLEVLQSPPDSTSGFTDYEAENASLDGPVVVPESVDDRNASGEGFVDFDGAGDQTITWTVEVGETGNYEIGFRYALAVSKADRPMEVTINGVNLGVVNFPGQSNEAENDWFFQELLVNLQAGSNTISVTAPEANGPNVDLLRVPDAPVDNFMPVYADVSDGARIELESGDSARTINDLTADFYFTVDADGLYRLDLAANAGASDGQGLSLTLNGQPLDVLVYPGEGDAGEEGTYVELEAGVEYNLRAVSSADGADDLDYLDVTPVVGSDNADIAVQSGDAAYYSDRLHFSYLENNSASNDNRDFKESATVTISNTGTSELAILDADIDGPFVLEDPSAFDGLMLAAGASVQVTVLFDRDSYTAPTNDAGDGVFEGRIRLVTNDADSPIAEIHMAGFWQARDEGGWEPNVNEVWEVFGFGNRIDGLTTVGGGENSVLNDFDLYRPVNDDEVLSRYWTLADGAGEAKITQLAAYHGAGGATLGIHNPGNKGQDIIFSNHAGDNNQSLLPIKSDGQFATANFSLADIPGGWTGQGVFGIEVANLSTDPSLNPEGGGTPPADADGIERGYTVRMFRALDAEGNVIPNTYLGIMDYTGINYDYNDNMFVIEGVTPVAGGELTVINNDGVPSNDRLVMSRIENPANAAQEVHDEATITIRNDGFETLDINSIEVSDTTLFELTEAFAAVSLEPGESIDVTVRFIADDPNDASLYEASLIINSSDADEGEKVIQLAGLAQNQSESGQEPLVQEIINAFGYSTNVAEGQMNQGGLVEANGDEILSPYFQRADGGSPIKITQLAAYHTQGDVARLFVHDVDSRNLDEILAHDEADGQTLLPRTLNNGDLLTTTTLDRDAPFGFFAEISGRQGYISWSDPDANLYEDTIDAIGNPGTNLNWDENDGHLIRVYVAKDAAGNVIPDTYIVIQDYAGVNYDYNDNIFLVENVQTYDPTGAEDADGNGRVDLYDDDDNDGVPNFIDDPDPVGQTAFNAGETAWAVGSDGLTLEAKLYDNGGQGVAYNDTTAAHQGAAFRADEAVDISNGTEALGYIADGEWVEYTLNVETAGTYTLSFSTSATTDGKSITAAFEQGAGFYTPAQVQTLPNTGSFGSFQTVGPLTFELEEGEQVLRLTFNGGQLDLASFTLDFEAPVDDGQSAFNDTQTAWEVGAEGLSLEARFYDNGGQDVAYNDTTTAHQGDAFRSDEAVDISTPSQAIGFIEDGEWVEYTINVAEDGVYDLDFLTSMDSSNPAARSITASFAKGDTPYVTASSVGVSPTGSWTSFTQTDTTQVALEAGEQVLRLTFNGGPMDLASFNLVPVAPAEDGQQAFTDSGDPWQVGSDFTLDAANYDEGGQDVAYNDSGDAQLGSDFRGDGVDIVGDGDAIGWVDDGEWVEYTLNIAQDGTYDLSFLSALGDGSGPQRSITATFTKGDGTPYASSDAVVVSPTGGWSNFQPTDATQVALEAGEQVMRLTFNGGSQDLASFSLARDGQQAFNAGATPWLVDAEDGLALDAALFDEGEQGEAYNELSAAQLGTGFRDEPVDIVGQGEAIGWVENGEWVEYTINVEQAGSHTLSFVTSNPNNGRTITASVEQDGVTYDQASGSVPNSGTWGNFVDGPSVTLDLEEGIQVLRLTFNGGSQDLASFQISRDPDVSAASLSSMDMMAMAGIEENVASQDELVAMSDDVSLSGVQENDQGALL
ncbi:carbohydrate-binding protein [Halomonas sp. A40-4]|uniref:carbohydrate-binding protein n=1 Tax=Halomonas sp. A40-4 TaxID=2785909 RepID=UPI0018EFB367|nr:carbohydrate-binding protein [Halomonas sp. A40-4]QPL45858.1 carbohydrate-binding protein [Halomonas sp. A40-4]